MRDLPSSTDRTARRDATTQIRHDTELARKIETASRYLGVDKSVLLRAAIEHEASRVIEGQTRHVLTPEDAAQFAAALDRPPRVTPRALRTGEAYRSRVVDAD